MPTVNRTPRPSRTEVRRRLLDAAVEVFADNGFSRSTLDDVAESAGFSKGAVYSNFASKDELFYALMDDQIAGRIAMVQGLLASTSELGIRDAMRLTGATLAKASIQERRWQLLFVDFWSRAVRDRDVGRTFTAHRRTLRAAITGALVSTFPDIEASMSMTVEDIATTLLALSNGLAIEHLADPESMSGDLFADVLTRLAGGPRDNV